MWIHVEYHFILSFMAGTIVFVIVRCLHRVTLKITAASVQMPANSADLLGVYAVQVQFLLTFFTPFAVTLGCYIREPSYLLGPDGTPGHREVLAAPLVLTGLQSALFYIIVFMRAINEVDPMYERTNLWRQKVHFAFRHLALWITPCAVILTVVIQICGANDGNIKQVLMPLFVFLLVTNALWLLVYALLYRHAFAQSVSQNNEMLEGLQRVEKICYELGIIELGQGDGYESASQGARSLKFF